MMLRRFLLASALLVTGTIVAAPSAFAEDVTFSGAVASTCVFGSATAGTISTGGANATSLSGAGATIGLACNYGTTLSVAAPDQTGGTAILSGTKSSSVTSSSVTAANKTTTDGGTPIDIVSGEATTLTVGMTAGNGTTIIPADTYTYTVTLTATP